MAQKDGNRGAGAFSLIIALIVLVAAITAGIRIIPLYVHGSEVFDAMDEAANFGGLKPLDKLQYEIFMKAQDARAPLKLEDIHVERNGPYIVISAKYTQSVDLFGYRYVYTFNKKVEKLVF